VSRRRFWQCRWFLAERRPAAQRRQHHGDLASETLILWVLNRGVCSTGQQWSPRSLEPRVGQRRAAPRRTCCSRVQHQSKPSSRQGLYLSAALTLVQKKTDSADTSYPAKPTRPSFGSFATVSEFLKEETVRGTIAREWLASSQGVSGPETSPVMQMQWKRGRPHDQSNSSDIFNIAIPLIRCWYWTVVS
jgi:hypothetical protein